MKKETSVAIVIGSVLGLSIALFLVINTKNAQFFGKKVIDQPSEVAPIVTVSQPIQHVAFAIQSPDTGSITQDKTITIKGNAPKGSLIVFQSPIKDMIVTTDKDTFSVDFPLAFGENLIHVTLYGKDMNGVGQEKELRIYQLDAQ